MPTKILQTNQVQDTANTSLVTILANTFNATNSAANSAATYANGILVLANSGLNWINTATLNVSITANGTTQSNIAWSANLTAIGIPGIQTALGTMNTNITAAYNQANIANALALASQVIVFANGNQILANTDLNFNNTATINVSATANGTIQTNLAFSVNDSATYTPVLTVAQAAYGQANIGLNLVAVYVNTGPVTSGLIGNAPINYVNTPTINVTATVGNGADVRINTSFSVNTSAISGSPAGANGQLQFNNNGAFGGQANLTYNTAAGLISADANVRVANGNMLFFGGAQANGNANSKFAITYNATSTTLDFMVFTS